jgi:hypothetical protein
MAAHWIDLGFVFVLSLISSLHTIFPSEDGSSF